MPDKSSVLAKDIKMLTWVPIITAVVFYASVPLSISTEIKDVWESVGNAINVFGLSFWSFSLVLTAFLFRRFLRKHNSIESNGLFMLFLIVSAILLIVLPLVFLFK